MTMATSHDNNALAAQPPPPVPMPVPTVAPSLVITGATTSTSKEDSVLAAAAAPRVVDADTDSDRQLLPLQQNTASAPKPTDGEGHKYREMLLAWFCALPNTASRSAVLAIKDSHLTDLLLRMYRCKKERGPGVFFAVGSGPDDISGDGGGAAAGGARYNHAVELEEAVAAGANRRHTAATSNKKSYLRRKLREKELDRDFCFRPIIRTPIAGTAAAAVPEPPAHGSNVVPRGTSSSQPGQQERKERRRGRSRRGSVNSGASCGSDTKEKTAATATTPNHDDSLSRECSDGGDCGGPRRQRDSSADKAGLRFDGKEEEGGAPKGLESYLQFVDTHEYCDTLVISNALLQQGPDEVMRTFAGAAGIDRFPSTQPCYLRWHAGIRKWTWQTPGWLRGFHTFEAFVVMKLEQALWTHYWAEHRSLDPRGISFVPSSGDTTSTGASGRCEKFSKRDIGAVPSVAGGSSAEAARIVQEQPFISLQSLPDDVFPRRIANQGLVRPTGAMVYFLTSVLPRGDFRKLLEKIKLVVARARTLHFERDRAIVVLDAAARVPSKVDVSVTGSGTRCEASCLSALPAVPRQQEHGGVKIAARARSTPAYDRRVKEVVKKKAKGEKSKKKGKDKTTTMSSALKKALDDLDIGNVFAESIDALRVGHEQQIQKRMNDMTGKSNERLSRWKRTFGIASDQEKSARKRARLLREHADFGRGLDVLAGMIGAVESPTDDIVRACGALDTSVAEASYYSVTNTPCMPRVASLSGICKRASSVLAAGDSISRCHSISMLVDYVAASPLSRAQTPLDRFMRKVLLCMQYAYADTMSMNLILSEEAAAGSINGGNVKQWKKELQPSMEPSVEITRPVSLSKRKKKKKKKKRKQTRRAKKVEDGEDGDYEEMIGLGCMANWYEKNECLAARKDIPEGVPVQSNVDSIKRGMAATLLDEDATTQVEDAVVSKTYDGTSESQMSSVVIPTPGGCVRPQRSASSDARPTAFGKVKQLQLPRAKGTDAIGLSRNLMTRYRYDASPASRGALKASPYVDAQPSKGFNGISGILGTGASSGSHIPPWVTSRTSELLSFTSVSSAVSDEPWQEVGKKKKRKLRNRGCKKSASRSVASPSSPSTKAAAGDVLRRARSSPKSAGRCLKDGYIPDNHGEHLPKGSPNVSTPVPGGRSSSVSLPTNSYLTPSPSSSPASSRTPLIVRTNARPGHRTSKRSKSLERKGAVQRTRFRSCSRKGGCSEAGMRRPGGASVGGSSACSSDGYYGGSAAANTVGFGGRRPVVTVPRPSFQHGMRAVAPMGVYARTHPGGGGHDIRRHRRQLSASGDDRRALRSDVDSAHWSTWCERGIGGGHVPATPRYRRASASPAHSYQYHSAAGIIYGRASSGAFAAGGGQARSFSRVRHGRSSMMGGVGGSGVNGADLYGTMMMPAFDDYYVPVADHHWMGDNDTGHAHCVSADGSWSRKNSISSSKSSIWSSGVGADGGSPLMNSCVDGVDSSDAVSVTSGASESVAEVASSVSSSSFLQRPSAWTKTGGAAARHFEPPMYTFAARHGTGGAFASVRQGSITPPLLEAHVHPVDQRSPPICGQAWSSSGHVGVLNGRGGAERNGNCAMQDCTLSCAVSTSSSSETHVVSGGDRNEVGEGSGNSRAKTSAASVAFRALRDLMEHSPNRLLKLDVEISHFQAYISSVTGRQRRVKLDIVKQVRESAQNLWPRVRVMVYGSFATSLSLPSSDLDLVIVGVGNSSAVLDAFASKLRKCEWVKSLQTIATAKVPVIKVISQLHGQRVDITFALHSLSLPLPRGVIPSPLAHTGPASVQLITHYSSWLPELQPLTLVLKQFLYERCLSNTYTGGLSSYCLVVMLLSFLLARQRPGAIPPPPGLLMTASGSLPAFNSSGVGVGVGNIAGGNVVREGMYADRPALLRRVQSTAVQEAQQQHLNGPAGNDVHGRGHSMNGGRAGPFNLGALLLGFFHFYGHQFDYERMGISLQRFFVFLDRPARTLVLGDPFNAHNNIGKSCFAMWRIKAAFADAYKDLVADVAPFPTATTLLSRIISMRGPTADELSQ